VRAALGFAVIVTALLGGAPATSAQERHLDFQGGFVMSSPVTESFTFFPGISLQSRWFVAEHAYVAGIQSADLGIDDRNPERVEEVGMIGLGAGAGVCAGSALGLTGFAGAQLEWLQAWDWPVGDRDANEFHGGLRGGPAAGVAVGLGRFWGHPMAIEAKVAYLFYRVPEGDGGALSGWQSGLFLTGVLFPEPAPAAAPGR
jgi:hypothetical protein